MLREIKVQRKDWSLSLEDDYYADKPEELLQESIEATRQTAMGCYVNIVTPEACGHPDEWLLPKLEEKLQAAGVSAKQILYIDECGCGGYVSRIYR